ncbi:MAG: hypothetical protein WC201_03635, partial [Bacilli bacterium]
MKKQPFIIFALSLVSLLAACSYGGTSVVSHSEFTTFYNEENLDNQQHYAFALGDGITINALSLDEEDNKISQS